MLTRLAVRNLHRHLSRFAVVLLALSLGFAAVVVLLGVTGGMTQTLRVKAARYFAGDLVVFSFSPDRRIAEQAEVARVLRSLPSAATTTRRTEYYGGDGTVFFAGSSVRQRKLVGVDWSLERTSFQQLDFVEGSVPLPTDLRGILISESTATRLGARVGDDVTAVFSTLGGQRNSLELVIRGVYRDTSFFGYASYLDIEVLNAALGHPPGTATAMGAVLRPGYVTSAEGEAVRTALSLSVPTYPTIRNRAEQVTAIGLGGAGARLAVMTLGANLAEVDDILNSLVTVATLATIVFLSIVIIGVGNTYRMVVFERTQELGTMRALGLSRARMVVLVGLEAGWLAVLGSFFGGVLGLVLLGLVILVDWGANPLTGLFLQNNRLAPVISMSSLFAAIATLLVAALIGALGPAIKAARQRPVDALRSGE